MSRRRTISKERYEEKRRVEYRIRGVCPYCKKRIGSGIYGHMNKCEKEHV